MEISFASSTHSVFRKNCSSSENLLKWMEILSNYLLANIGIIQKLPLWNRKECLSEGWVGPSCLDAYGGYYNDVLNTIPLPNPITLLSKITFRIDITDFFVDKFCEE